MWGLVVGLEVLEFATPRGFFPFFFFVWESGGFWARALQKLSVGLKPRARAVSTATNVYRKKIDTQKVYVGLTLWWNRVAMTARHMGARKLKKPKGHTHLEVT